ncbi:MAG TPA: terminase large subunit [Paludibacteraceae bacterium]|nr:terminase large subunit [Paludibacteraceae bacterium]
MNPKNYIKTVEKYISDVLSGEKIAGKLEILAVKRHLSDIENAHERKIFFDDKAARKAFAFFSLLKHSKGVFFNKPFDLSPWQAFIVYSLFGWKRADGSRRFRYAYVEVARKNGKTTFAAAIALLMMVFDGERGAEIYFAATKEKQAKICWDEAKNMVGTSGLSKYITVFRSSNTLVMDSTLSKMEPLSGDSKVQDGLNVHFAVCDEKHAWKTDELYNVLTSATGARRQPMIFTITTAGFNKSYPCFDERKVNVEILEGVKQQDNTFVMIFTLDPGDDYNDQRLWQKANPNIGISTNREYIFEEYEIARNHRGTKLTNFLTKLLNIWVDAPTVWIPDEKVAACSYDTTEEMLYGKECYSGLDLASHVDVNALAHFFPNVNGHPVAKLFFWVPEAKIQENADRVDYRLWREQKFMFSTPGDLIDTEWITNGILEVTKKYKCLGLAYDPYKAHGGIVQGLIKGGMERIIDEYSQSIRSMSEPTKELERMVTGAEIDLMNNPVLRWMFRNVTIYTDPNNNIKLDKSKSQNKIDGVVALAMAIGEYMTKTAGKKQDINKWVPRSMPSL